MSMMKDHVGFTFKLQNNRNAISNVEKQKLFRTLLSTYKIRQLFTQITLILRPSSLTWWNRKDFPKPVIIMCPRTSHFVTSLSCGMFANLHPPMTMWLLFPHIQNTSINLHHCSMHPERQGSLKTGQQQPVRSQNILLNIKSKLLLLFLNRSITKT